MKKTFEYKRISGGILAEYTDGKSWWLEYTDGGETKKLPMYDIVAEKTEEIVPYHGHTLEDVLASGKDLLGEELMAKGEVQYSDVIGVLPKITENAYSFVGGPASHSNMTVDTRGAVYRQLSGRDLGGEAAPDYEPWLDMPELNGIMPRQAMLAEEIPVLINVYDLPEEKVEIVYFIEPGDSGRDPALWIRKKRYSPANAGNPTYIYNAIELFYELPDAPIVSDAFDADQIIVEYQKYASDSTVIDVLADTVAYWIAFAKKGATISLPEKRLERVTRGAMAAAAVTCTTDRPHYGHKYYGKEIHDNFPPNYIWLLETACIMGRESWAKRVFAHLVNYATNDEGEIVYRQGRAQNPGASATEYACILFLVDRYFEKLGIGNLNEEQILKLSGMGNIILAHCTECPEFGGKVLVKMCAEADTNNRIHVYLNNNLWSIRGLRSLVSILTKLGIDGGEKYSEMAETLWQNVSKLLEEKTVYDERFGYLPPFRFDYTATPHTLSYTKDTFVPLADDVFEEYLKASVSRGDQKTEGQDVTENCYANYRYYPEALSSMLLPEELANGAETLRERLGGEMMGMTRFRSWVDNWPVLHHARFLIETGRIDKYLLLLYAHTELHGNRERLCYYEQIKPFGRVSAHDCLPSLLTTPAMVGWAFCYETMKDNKVRLLSAIPKDWYSLPFEASGIGYSGGSVSIKSDGKEIEVTFSHGAPEGCELVWRCKDSVSASDIVKGSECIEQIIGNKLVIKPEVKRITLCIK